jgi:hypothetical protein
MILMLGLFMTGLVGLLHAHNPSTEEIFTKIYTKNSWRDTKSRSGTGSNLRQTTYIRNAIPECLKSIGARSLLDAPCGDFFWMKEVVLPVELYVGVDIVPDLIVRNNKQYKTAQRSFLAADLASDQLPQADVILCRDCLVHLSYADAFKVLKNFKASGAKYLLTTTFTGRSNRDIKTGQWRPLNVQQAPFNFPDPIMLINEHCTEKGFGDKCLGLWLLADIPTA